MMGPYGGRERWRGRVISSSTFSIDYIRSTVHVKLPLQGRVPPINGSEGKRYSPVVGASVSGAEDGPRARPREQTEIF
jgi:hypothetical protein